MNIDPKPLVYIAGPYTAGDPVANTAAACEVADRLTDSGLVRCVVPHLSLLQHFRRVREHKHWVELGCAIVERCDAVFRIRGSSEGAFAECQHAIDRQIPVYTNERSLLAWAKERCSEGAER